MSLPAAEFFLRTEDIPSDELLKLFVETSRDREVIEKLKSRTPVVIVGSRGVGKSFLLRITEAELGAAFATDRVLPVYATFNKSALLVTNDPLQFQHYMLARICTRLVRALTRHGLITGAPASLSILSGGPVGAEPSARMEEISRAYEDSFQAPGAGVDRTGLPSVDALRDAVEDLCEALGIKRLVLLMDEAAHVFRPEQQRQFFTLFRDLRSPYIGCNAAVYPGVTVFGESFQPAHDAAFESADRDVMSGDYIAHMREIVEKQAESTLAADIAKNGQNFAVLAFAASGNPRLLLKTVARAQRLGSGPVNDIIKSFYRTDLWAEHSGLTEKYSGHRALIDWGRNFVESSVLPELKRRNDAAIQNGTETTCSFWIHRDAPEVVREALRLLEYTGVVHEHTKAIRATRGEIGDRYLVSLGCLFALEAVPRDSGFQVTRHLGVRRFVEYGPSHSAYEPLVEAVPNLVECDAAAVLERHLARTVDVLDITDWQKSALKSIGLRTVGSVLTSREAELREIKYVGEKRSRRMMNAATAAVLEYLSG